MCVYRLARLLLEASAAGDTHGDADDDVPPLAICVKQLLLRSLEALRSECHDS